MKNIKAYDFFCKKKAGLNGVSEEKLFNLVDSFSMSSKEDVIWWLLALDKGCIEIPCPYSGEEIRCTLTFKLGYQFFFLFLCSNDKYIVLLTPDSVDSGFPIVGLSIPEDGIFVCREISGKCELWMRHASEVVRLAMGGAGECFGLYTNAVALIQSHKNFAHCLINIFPAVQYVIDNSVNVSKLNFCTGSGQHPLGWPEDVFKGLSFIQHNKLEAGGFEIYPGAAIPLGIGRFTYGVKIQRRLQENILNWAEGESTEKCRCLVKTIGDKEHGCVVWVSIRGQGARNAKNFHQTVCMLISLIVEKFDKPAVIFDGLSLQNGFSLEDSVRGGGKISKQIEEEVKVAEAIVGQCVEGCDFYYGIGLNLADSFLLSGVATSYFCHDGSLQHKIGWVRPKIPGVVHGNHQRNRGQGKGWHPVEGGYAPRYVPPECVVDLKKGGRSKVPSANYPYEFVNFEKLKCFMGLFFSDPQGFVCK